MIPLVRLTMTERWSLMWPCHPWILTTPSKPTWKVMTATLAGTTSPILSTQKMKRNQSPKKTRSALSRLKRARLAAKSTTSTMRGIARLNKSPKYHSPKICRRP